MAKENIISRNLVRLILVFTACVCSNSIQGQEQPAVKEKWSLFVYGENDSPIAMDFGGGFGIDNVGAKGGLLINLDVYHIMAGFKYTTSGFAITGSRQNITEKSFHLGYRFRTQYLMISISSGFSRQKFKCTSGLNYDCYNYVEETISATPVLFQGDFILTDEFALGVLINHLISDRKDLTGIMFVMKFGAFRNIF